MIGVVIGPLAFFTTVQIGANFNHFFLTSWLGPTASWTGRIRDRSIRLDEHNCGRDVNIVRLENKQGQSPIRSPSNKAFTFSF